MAEMSLGPRLCPCHTMIKGVKIVCNRPVDGGYVFCLPCRNLRCSTLDGETSHLGEPPVGEPRIKAGGREPQVSVLAEADSLINGERQADYDTPLRSFTRIARYWDAFLAGRHDPSAPLAAEEISLMLALLKIARTQGPSKEIKRDSIVDGAGYFGCLELIQRDRDA